MSNVLAQVENRLLMPADLSPDSVAAVLGQLVSAPGVDAADVPDPDDGDSHIPLPPPKRAARSRS